MFKIFPVATAKTYYLLLELTTWFKFYLPLLSTYFTYRYCRPLLHPASLIIYCFCQLLLIPTKHFQYCYCQQMILPTSQFIYCLCLPLLLPVSHFTCYYFQSLLLPASNINYCFCNFCFYQLHILPSATAQMFYLLTSATTCFLFYLLLLPTTVSTHFTFHLLILLSLHLIYWFCQPLLLLFQISQTPSANFWFSLLHILPVITTNHCYHLLHILPTASATTATTCSTFYLPLLPTCVLPSKQKQSARYFSGHEYIGLNKDFFCGGGMSCQLETKRSFAWKACTKH